MIALDGAPHGLENWEGHAEWTTYKRRLVEWIRRWPPPNSSAVHTSNRATDGGQAVQRKDIQPFNESLENYERWLAGQLDKVWRGDLDTKHEKMRESAFVFLRATYWRWAETILTICEDLARAPMVIGIGDIHLENYGVWRDREGRLVWGINDVDEAADMPYTVDVVRLAASALLSRPAKRRARKGICADILAGYRAGLATPRPFTIDEQHMWLRRLFAVAERERRRFWKKMDKLREDNRMSDRYRKPLESRVPEEGVTYEKFARRAAGTGSLGRPRWVGLGSWRGGRFVREAKAIVPSAWSLVHRQPRAHARPGALLAAGRFRAPDPWYQMHYRGRATAVTQRPQDRSPGTSRRPGRAGDAGSHGIQLANVHLGTADVSKAIRNDLDHRGNKWLIRAAETAAEFVTADFQKWRG